MFSKKNKKQYDLKHADGRQHWSLRKTTLGMASVLLSTTIYLGSTNVLVHADTTSDSQTSQATTSSSSSDTSSSSSQTSSSESSSATSASSTSEQTNSTTSSNSEASSSASSSESSTSSVSSSSSSSSSDSNENETNTSSNVVSTSSSSSADTNDSTTDQTSSSADGSSSSNQSLYTDEASATSAANKITEDNKTTTTTTTISTAYDNKSTASTQKSSFDFSQYSGLPEYYMWMSYINSNKDIKANASSNVVISDPVYDATTNTVTYTIHFNPSNGIVTTSGSTLTDASAQYAIEISKNLKVVSISYGYNGNMTDGTSTYTSGGGTLSSSSTNGTATKMIVSNTTYANTSTTGLSSSNAISSVSSDIGQTIIFSPNTTLYYQASNSKGLDVTIVATVDSSVSTSFTGVNAIESYIPKSLWNNNSGIRDMLGDTPVVMSTYKAVTSSTIAEGQAASNTTTTTMTNATGVASTSIPVSVVFDNSSSESNITSVDYTLTKSASSLKEANSTAYVNATDDSTSGSLSASNNYTQNYYDVEAIPSGTTVSSSALASDLLTSDALTVTDVKINSTSGTYSYLVSQTNSGIEIHVIDKTDLETAVNDQNDVQKTSAYYNASDDKKQAYDDAVAAGQTVLNNDSATQSEVDSATTAINSAKSALDGETTDKNALETAVNDQSDVQKTSAYYNASDDKKQAYDDAVSAGQTVLNDDSATQSEVDSATSAIDNAKSALDGQATDKTALETAVNDQNDVQKTSAYYNASDDKKQAYDDAVAAGQTVLNNDSATQSEVDSATSAINNAKSALDGQATDKTALETAVNEQSTVESTPAYYNASDDKKQAYDDAVSAGQKVLNNDSATQSEADSATTTINSAKAALDGETTDKRALETAVNDQSNVQKTSAYYNASDEKKQAYDDAVAAGQTVLNNDSATQSEVDSATTAINNAKSALDGETTDKSALETAVNDQSDVQKTSAYYNASDDKKQAYDDAVSAGQTVLNNDSATQSEVDSATTAIDNAKAALDGQATETATSSTGTSDTTSSTTGSTTESSVDKSALETAVNEQSTVESTSAYYNASDDKKQAYNDAVSAGQTVLNDDSATQSEVDSATTAINNAKAALDGQATETDTSSTGASDTTSSTTGSTTENSVDKSGLETAVNEQSTVEATDAYKNASNDKKQAYDDAVSAGQTVLNDDSATQSEVDSATTAINNAKAALDGQATDTSSTGASDTTSSTTGST
ncbi:FIVAR domain-containing protein, partial [Lactobacillus mulieris]|uniref:FIVAR domain-containing protein n=1 Tax=Lactobacillus mulieris TaxID=2508708 RepID=UPI0022447A3B